MDRWLSRLRRSTQASLAYGNTAVVSEELAALSRDGLPCIWHIHELGTTIARLAGHFGADKHCAKHFVAASSAVKSCLLLDHQIAEDLVTVVHEFIPPTVLDIATARRTRAEVRGSLGIGPQAFVVAGCGTVDWRKGADLFCWIAAMLVKRLPEGAIHFVWIGGDPASETFRQLGHDLNKMGLTGRVHFTGTVESPARFFDAADVFLLTSREDPFPLAMLEAAARGLPVLCFEDSGGGVEFVETDAGHVVPYLDLEEMVRRICVLMRDSGKLLQLGNRARAKVNECYTTSLQAPKLWEVIECNMLEKNTQPRKSGPPNASSLQSRSPTAANPSLP